MMRKRTGKLRADLNHVLCRDHSGQFLLATRDPFRVIFRIFGPSPFSRFCNGITFSDRRKMRAIVGVLSEFFCARQVSELPENSQEMCLEKEEVKLAIWAEKRNLGGSFVSEMTSHYVSREASRQDITKWKPVASSFFTSNA